MLGKVRILYGFPGIILGCIVFSLTRADSPEYESVLIGHFRLMLKKSHRPFGDKIEVWMVELALNILQKCSSKHKFQCVRDLYRLQTTEILGRGTVRVRVELRPSTSP